MRINTNMNAMTALNQSTKNTALAGASMGKLSSGLRINQAGDDAAGLAISEKMRAQIRGMEQADRNVQDGISLVQTAEGALEEAGNIVQRMRELSVQGANDTLSQSDKEKIVTELTELQSEISKITTETKFNGRSLLDGVSTTVTIQAGATGETRELSMGNLSAVATALTVTLTSASTGDAFRTAITTIDSQLEAINKSRATLGAQQNRLEATSSNLTTSTENLTAAESRIRDVDVAKEMMNLSKLNLLNQASQAMMMQAKSQPEGVMQLLR
ncbi:flagellin [Clostridioides difficile]